MSTNERLSAVEDGLKMAGLAAKPVLTFTEAVTYTGISASYLYKLTSQKLVPHYKPSGKLVYFDRTELDKWLLSRRVNTADEVGALATIHCMAKPKGKASK